MRKDKIKQIVSGALIHRGFSEEEASKLIRLIADEAKEPKQVSIKHINVYA